ncbi:class I SAM-dependent methyltransferase [Pseudidiomarina marina]|nr:methyltransferase [Pseudidiomarina marina]
MTVRNRMLNLLFIPITVLGLSACSESIESDADSVNLLQQAINSESRSASNRSRDEFRHPAETLEFFGIQPNSTVVEISPGGGWYTEILAPYLKDDGLLYAAHFPANSSSEYYQRSRQAFMERVTNDSAFSAVVVTEFAPMSDSVIAPPESADMVLTFRNLHNWYMSGGEEAVQDAFMQFYTALKPGGVLGVVDHRLPETRPDEDMANSGYMKESFAIAMAESVGFELAERSEINANSNDTADHPRGVWTLPPTLRLGDEDKEKYTAIGESDRFTLKFVKPKS